MPQECDVPCPVGALVVFCDCGREVLGCALPYCLAMHAVRWIPACGACTATGGQPVVEEVA